MLMSNEKLALCQVYDSVFIKKFFYVYILIFWVMCVGFGFLFPYVVLIVKFSQNLKIWGFTTALLSID